MTSRFIACLSRVRSLPTSRSTVFAAPRCVATRALYLLSQGRRLNFPHFCRVYELGHVDNSSRRSAQDGTIRVWTPTCRDKTRPAPTTNIPSRWRTPPSCTSRPDLSRTPRTIQRYCEKSGISFRDALKRPSAMRNISSRPRQSPRTLPILKRCIGLDRPRRVATDATDVAAEHSGDEPRQEAPTGLDMSRPVATNVVEENKDEGRDNPSDRARHVATSRD